MALTASGQLSLGDIATEMGVSLSNVSLTTQSTTGINTNSESKPDGSTPHSISEFYSYDHSATSYTTDGLLLDLDAGNVNSYPGTGTAVYSLYGNHTGSMDNGLTYTATSGGYFEMDGVDNRLSVPHSSELKISTGSIEVWYNVTSRGVMVHTSINTDNRFDLIGGFFTGAYPDESLGTVGRRAGTTGRIEAYRNGHTWLNSQGWVQHVYTLDGTTSKYYINGSEVTLTKSPGPGSDYFLNCAAASGDIVFGDRNTFTNLAVNGKFSIGRIYGKALSSSEVTANFNYAKDRYGL